MVEKVVKSAMDFKGWKFSKWFLGNWKTIKELVKIGAPFLVSYLTVHNPYLVGFLTVLGKFLLDSGEYWYKELKE